MIRLLATTALGLVLASAAFAQSPGTNTKSEQTPQSQSNSATPSTTSPSSAGDKQQSTSQPQQSPTSAQNTQTATQPSNTGSGTSNAANSTDTSSRPQSGTASSSTTGNQPATQQSANPPPATNTNQAQDRSNPPPSNSTNQAQQAPSATGTNQAQQAPNAPASNQAQGNQAQGERTGTSSQAAAQGDVNLNRQQETKISASISHLNVRPLTNVNFSLNVGTVVPRDIQLSTLPPDVVEIVPQYRGYSFALVKDQIVVVDPATYKIVTVLPYSGQSTATTTTRERSASKFSDRDREVIRKHAKTRTEGRSEARTTGSTARTEIHVGDRVPESVEVEEFPSTVYRDAPDLREYRYIHRDTRTYVIEPRERRVIEEID